MRETQVQSLVREDSLEKEMATDSSIFAWKIPWREEPGRLQSKGGHKSVHGNSLVVKGGHSGVIITCYNNI